MTKRPFSRIGAVVLFFVFAGICAPGSISAQTASPPPAAKHEIVKLKMLSMAVGGNVYVLSFALGEITNKYHPWIRIDCQEGRGSEANLKNLAERPEMRKDTLIFTHELSNVYAREAREPFKIPYTGARVIAAMTGTNILFVTLDKRIKTKQDFVGKRVMTMRPGTINAKLHEVLLKDVWGIGDKVKLNYGTFESVRDSLQDGLVDIGCISISGLPGSDYWDPIPVLNELMSVKDVYFISVPPDDVRAMADKARLPVKPCTVPAKAIGPKQPEAIQAFTTSLSWWADQEMSEEIVYEITKVIYEHANKFEEHAGVLGKLVSGKTMAKVGAPEDLFHPGAMRFYREKGMQVGLD
jgi:uncharacterized protein